MKIEKISETQIKFVLNESDLTDRNIKLSELAYGSEKTQELFHEMMDQAFIQCGFKSENAPLMIEAIPVTLDSIMVIVTKVSHSKDIESKLNLFPSSESKAKNYDFSNSFKSSSKNDILIYSFTNLEDIMLVSARINDAFKGSSSVYKNNNLYFLILENLGSDSKNLNHIVGEYGKKHMSTLKAKYYFVEHGEIIIEEHAVNKLSNI